PHGVQKKRGRALRLRDWSSEEPIREDGSNIAKVAAINRRVYVIKGRISRHGLNSGQTHSLNRSFRLRSSHADHESKISSKQFCPYEEQIRQKSIFFNHLFIIFMSYFFYKSQKFNPQHFDILVSISFF